LRQVLKKPGFLSPEQRTAERKDTMARALVHSATPGEHNADRSQFALASG